ncbi:hypothetical protein CsSME_00001089 [Camellia sinensis var. sinensis]
MASGEDYFNCSEKWQMDCKAIKELNIKTKNWELLTDETFTREDLITIQYSCWTFDNWKGILMHLIGGWVLVDFDHVKNSLKLDDVELMKMSSDPTYNINEEEDEPDKIGSWYSNAGKEASESGSVGGGVGKYWKVRNVQAESAATD